MDLSSFHKQKFRLSKHKGKHFWFSLAHSEHGFHGAVIIRAKNLYLACIRAYEDLDVMPEAPDGLFYSIEVSRAPDEIGVKIRAKNMQGKWIDNLVN